MPQYDRTSGLTGSAAIKVPCAIVATTNLTKTGAVTIGSYTTVDGDRVLQAVAAGHVDNGIWECNTDGTWARAPDFDGPKDATKGSVVPTLKDSTGADNYQWYQLTTANGFVIGDDALTFALMELNAEELRDDLAASSGAGLVGFSHAETYSAGTVGDRLKNVIFFTDAPYSAVGDGVTDDLAAVKLALESGFIVDGGGLTYAISGTCSPTAIAGLRNANFVQIGNNTATNMTVLNIQGLSNFNIDNVKIDMGSNVVTLESDDGNNGLKVWGTQSGLTTTYIENINISRVTVTGDGCGTGIHVRHAKKFSLCNCQVNDRVAGASPDPSNDSQNGIEITNCYDFRASDLSVNNLKTRLSAVDTIKWTRGVLFVEIRNCVLSNITVDGVDQGFDLSGAYDASVGYIGSRNWTLTGSSASNCDTYGFKFANVTRDGLVTGCIASNIGTAGFVFSPSGVLLTAGLEKYNTQNIDVVGCKVVNVLGTGWSSANAQGFRVMSNVNHADYPRAIRLKDCSVIDTQDTPTTLDAYASDATVPLYPTTDYNKSVANTTTGCTFSSTIATGYNGIGPDLCRVTGTTNQTITTATITTVDWTTNTTDPCRLHNTASNNDAIFIKTPGYYDISAQIHFASNATGTRQIRIYKNGGDIGGGVAITAPVTGAVTVVTSSVVAFLIAGDSIKVAVYQDSGGGLDVVRADSYLCVRLVS